MCIIQRGKKVYKNRCWTKLWKSFKWRTLWWLNQHSWECVSAAASDVKWQPPRQKSLFLQPPDYNQPILILFVWSNKDSERTTNTPVNRKSSDGSRSITASPFYPPLHHYVSLTAYESTYEEKQCRESNRIWSSRGTLWPVGVGMVGCWGGYSSLIE